MLKTVEDRDLLVAFTPESGVAMVCHARVDSGRPLVSFYDRRGPGEPVFIAAYHADDVIDTERGFNLHMGVPGWEVDADNMTWLRRVLTEWRAA